MPDFHCIRSKCAHNAQVNKARLAACICVPRWYGRVHGGGAHLPSTCLDSVPLHMMRLKALAHLTPSLTPSRIRCASALRWRRRHWCGDMLMTRTSGGAWNSRRQHRYSPSLLHSLDQAPALRALGMRGGEVPMTACSCSYRGVCGRA